MKRALKLFYLFLFALVTSFLLDSCHSSKRVTQSASVVETNPPEETYVQSPPPPTPPPRYAKPRKPPVKKHDTASEIELREHILAKRYAGTLEVSANAISNYQLYNFIDTWYGTPYKYGGKSHSGIDCSGFTSLLLQNVYHISASGSVLTIFKQCKRIKPSDLKEGDLVFFKINRKSLSHVGVYLQNYKFVHASVHSGVVIDDLHEDYYKKHFRAAGRLPQ